MQFKPTAVVGVNPAFDALVDAIQKGVPLAKLSRLYVAYMLGRNAGNKVHTSIALGIDRRTIQRWVKAGEVKG